MNFKDPWILFLIPFVIGAVFFLHYRNRAPSFRFPSIALLKDISHHWKTKCLWVPFALRLLTLVLVLIALSGPRSVLEETRQTSEGIDIVLTIDSSSSMAAEDFRLEGKRTNRLEAVKNVVRTFVEKRDSDRIGLIAFAGRAYTVCPLTTDYGWLLTNLERIKLGLMEDGTAIGSAISSSLARLENSKAKSRVIVLLTDGINNAGKITPLAAAQAAQALDVKIYTIGAGTRGYAPFPTKDVWGRTVYQNVQIDLDEQMLREIADLTGGQYFRAVDTESLKNIYQAIDALEKTEIEEFGYKEYRQLFGWFLAAALMILLLEMILRQTLFFQIP